MSKCPLQGEITQRRYEPTTYKHAVALDAPVGIGPFKVYSVIMAAVQKHWGERGASHGSHTNNY